MTNVPNLNAHQLIVFYYVAKEGSASMAADKMCLTQPTITYHLKSLEKYAGVKLFNIKKQRLLLTDAGEGLYKHAKETWIQLTNADKYLKTLRQNHICIGVSPLFHNAVTSALARIGKLYPEVNFEIVSAVSCQIVQKVSDLELNAGVIIATDYNNFNIKPVRISDGERLVFVASPNISIAKKDCVDWQDLENYPLILGSQGSLLRPIIIEKFKSVGIDTAPRFVLESINVDVGKIFAQEGNGVGLWYAKDVEAEVSAGKLKILQLPEKILVPVDIIVPKEPEQVPPIINKFIHFIKQEFTDLSVHDETAIATT